MTITVIVFETTGLSDLAPPLMGVVCVAKTLADALGGPRSIYDAHVALKCIPYLDDESNGDDGDAVVGDVMATAVRCVPDVAPHAAALSCLEDTRHNAFPVLAAGDGAFVGLVSRRELAALLAHVAALAADPRRPRGPAGPAPADAFSSSLQSRVAPLPPRAVAALEAAAPPLDRLDLRPYVDVAPVTVPPHCPVPRAFRIFKALGVRHLPVLDPRRGAVVGILTRKDLLLAHGDDRGSS